MGLLCAHAASAVALAAVAPAAAAVQGRDPGVPVRVESVDRFGRGTPETTLLTAWQVEGPVVASGPVADWMRVEFPPAEDRPEDTAAQAAPPPAPWSLELVGGGHLRGRPLEGDADHIQWQIGAGSDSLVVSVDLLWVRGLARGRLPAAPREQDLLVLRTPSGGRDPRPGWLVDLDGSGLHFEGAAGPQHILWRRVEALRLLEEEVDADAANAATSLLVLDDGSFLPWTPTGLDLRRGEMRGRLPWGGVIAVPMARVLALVRHGGPFQDLAAAAPASVEYPPAQVLDWSPRRGRSVMGRLLRVAGAVHPLGYGVKAPSELVFAVADKSLFTARVGVDDESAAQRLPQALVFEVWLDDDLLGQSKAVSLGEAAAPLRIEVPRGGNLRLRVVSPSADEGAGAHGDWLSPRVWPRRK